MKREMSVLAFWIIIIAIIAIVFVFYFTPAQNKLVQLKRNYKLTEQKCEALKSELNELKNELDALDDPFYVEKLLRYKYNWKPARIKETIVQPVADTEIKPIQKNR